MFVSFTQLLLLLLHVRVARNKVFYVCSHLFAPFAALLAVVAIATASASVFVPAAAATIMSAAVAATAIAAAAEDGPGPRMLVSRCPCC